MPAGMTEVRVAYKERGRKKNERGRSRIDIKKRGKEGRRERAGETETKMGGGGGSERDLRAHPLLIKEPSP